jgi:hypothetical protein
MDIDDVDYVKFEYRLRHRAIAREHINRAYVQIHNRGIKPAGVPPADKIAVKLLHANVLNSTSKPSDAPRFPALPSDLRTNFYLDSPISSTSEWSQIAKSKNFHLDLRH